MYGSGSLISPNIVLTCAHNVYDRKITMEATDLNFIPAMNGKKGQIF